MNIYGHYFQGRENGCSSYVVGPSWMKRIPEEERDNMVQDNIALKKDNNKMKEDNMKMKEELATLGSKFAMFEQLLLYKSLHVHQNQAHLQPTLLWTQRIRHLQFHCFCNLRWKSLLKFLHSWSLNMRSWFLITIPMAHPVWSCFHAPSTFILWRPTFILLLVKLKRCISVRERPFLSKPCFWLLVKC